MIMTRHDCVIYGVVIHDAEIFEDENKFNRYEGTEQVKLIQTDFGNAILGHIIRKEFGSVKQIQDFKELIMPPDLTVNDDEISVEYEKLMSRKSSTPKLYTASVTEVTAS